MEFIARIIPSLLIYAIIIAWTRGRCSRYEYLVKGLVAFGIIIISLILSVLGIPVISFVMVFVMLIALYNYVKYTIQRLYDLGMSGYYILLTLIPIVGIVMTIILFVKKSEIEPNEYDEAIKYKKFFKEKHFLDIYKDRIIFDDIEFNLEYYLKKYTVKISKYVEKNIFSDYLLANFSSQKENIYDLVEITGNDLLEVAKKLELIILYESQYIKIKGYKLFIRYYDFGYDIIINKAEHKLSKEIIDTFDFPGAYFEDEKYIYYKKVTREEIIECIKNVA
jgi:uncharacterized membrane protein YhaH (DUF805 family)